MAQNETSVNLAYGLAVDSYRQTQDRCIAIDTSTQTLMTLE